MIGTLVPAHLLVGRHGLRRIRRARRTKMSATDISGRDAEIVSL